MTNPNEHGKEMSVGSIKNSLGDIPPVGENLQVSHARLPQSNEILRAKVNLETAQMAWSEMQRYFASGAAIYVAPELDLVEAALQMSDDNTALVGLWMAAGQFGKVTDEQARLWLETAATHWVVVISPWVLVQPVVKSTGA